ncbi:uncharacterized protein N7477_002068 [Penicillium maclennaniae]|uniref:uncharacterized protein n=1 Tax=Penicillium maclennaniae TaxID=1343394 RepID=UPI0025409AC8|nr:uncharacterized protein N7477_002068 [Penicillium maclennaniae]KAJ5682128.1 hypothetical protein N7477_002068 [Penicillium maclennaniae]
MPNGLYALPGSSAEVNFQCQYGPQLTFLMKNTQTVQPSEVKTAAAGYKTIRVPASTLQCWTLLIKPKFVNEDPEGKSDGSGESRHGQGKPTSSCHFGPPMNLLSRVIGSGNKHRQQAGPGLGLFDFGVSPMSTQVPKGQAMTGSEFSDSTTAISSSGRSQSSHKSHEVSPSETLELLRHFRYEIAPWLDICDLGQLFGIQGLQVAMASQSIWISVLALSEASMKLQRSDPSIMGNDKG